MTPVHPRADNRGARGKKCREKRPSVERGGCCWLILDPVHVLFHMLEVPVWANWLVAILIAIGFRAVPL
jgi:hypothetical protein